MAKIDPLISLYASLPVQTKGLHGLGQLNLPPDSLEAQVAAARELERQELQKITERAFAEALMARKSGVSGIGGGFGMIERVEPRRALRGIGQATPTASDAKQEVAPASERPKAPDQKGISDSVASFLTGNPNASSSDLVGFVSGLFGQQSAGDKKKTDAKSEKDGQAKLASMVGGAPPKLAAELKISADPMTAAIAGAAFGAAQAAVQYLGEKLDQLGAAANCAWHGWEFCEPKGAMNYCNARLAESFGMSTPAALAFLFGPQIDEINDSIKPCDKDKPGQTGCGWPDKAEASYEFVGNTSVVKYRIKRINEDAALRGRLTLLNDEERQVMKREAVLKGMLAYISAQTSDIGLDMVVFESNLNWNSLTQVQKDAIQRAVDKQLAKVGGGGRGFIQLLTKGADGKILGMTPLTLGIVSASVVGVGLVSYYVWKKRRA